MTSETKNKSAGKCPIESIIDMHEDWARRASAGTGIWMFATAHAAREKLASLRAGILDMYPVPGPGADGGLVFDKATASRVDIIANHPAMLATADQVETVAEEVANLAQACSERFEAADKGAEALTMKVDGRREMCTEELAEAKVRLREDIEEGDAALRRDIESMRRDALASSSALDDRLIVETELRRAHDDSLRTELEALKRRVVILEARTAG